MYSISSNAPSEPPFQSENIKTISKSYSFCAIILVASLITSILVDADGGLLQK